MLKKEEQGIKFKKHLPKEERVREKRQQQQQQNPSWITSFLKLSSVEFQEVEKDNLQIKENMEK